MRGERESARGRERGDREGEIERGREREREREREQCTVLLYTGMDIVWVCSSAN